MFEKYCNTANQPDTEPSCFCPEPNILKEQLKQISGFYLYN